MISLRYRALQIQLDRFAIEDSATGRIMGYALSLVDSVRITDALNAAEWERQRELATADTARLTAGPLPSSGMGRQQRNGEQEP